MNEFVKISTLKRPPRHRRLPLPLTFEERAATGKREIRVPATFEEYLELSQTCDYRVHYREGHIISFIEIEKNEHNEITIMGEATVTHERIVMRMGYFLAQILGIDENYQILGSNAKIFIAADRKGCNPDVVVVQGEIEQATYKYSRRNMKGITNPFLVVEVLSESTRNFDLTEKLADYKLIPSLQQIIYVEQSHVWASTYIRQKENEWLNIDFTTLNDAIPIQNGSIALSKIYSKIF